MWTTIEAERQGHQSTRVEEAVEAASAKAMEALVYNGRS
jgi:hypothetical protein